jgi:penicillin-binding protein 2
LGIDLTGERAGLIPSPKWKKEQKDENWYIGDTYLTSIGQGDILVTPLQILTATAVFANNGTLFTPRLVSSIGDRDVEPEIIRKDFISADNLEVVREGMRRAVTDGSSKFLASLEFSVAGKTGTAQTGRARNHAWFTGFAPYENPEVVITVLLEEGDDSNYTVRLAKEILDTFDFAQYQP